MSHSTLDVVGLLRRVRDAESLAPSDIPRFVAGIVAGDIPDYQASAFLMAVYLRGLSDEATTALTLAMRDSGRILDFSTVAGVKVDKHSTGGVGDKISLPLAPLVAACGVPVPMLSGRGLGHTGGTLDKLEAIPGFRVDLDATRCLELVASLGLCMIGQSKDLAPADKKLYALRDVTATVESIPLITASILSKKLAEGIDALVLDVKVGRGAFMKSPQTARLLASSLVRVGSKAGLKMRALLTRMEEPLGRTIGNALEVDEALAILRNEGPHDTTELTLALGAEMLMQGGVANSLETARQQLTRAMANGSGLERFRQLIIAQHGDPRVIDEPQRLPRARYQTSVRAAKRGFVDGIDSLALGLAAVRLGAGRGRAEDKIDPAVGIVLTTTRGDEVDVGDELAVVHHQTDTCEPLAQIAAAFEIGETPPPAVSLILERHGDDDLPNTK